MPFVDETGLFHLSRFLKETAGLELSKEKGYLVEFRLKPIADEHGMSSLSQLCQELGAPERRQLRDKVIEAMTTHETLFFRDPRVFDRLRALITARRDAGAPTPRIWCAACSTGQEPYSLAMMLLDLLPQPAPECIVATDIADETLATAAEGRYNVLQVNRGLPIAQLVRHFQKDGAGWKVQPRVRQLVSFRRSNLMEETPPGGPFDFVLCRNVLIYFDRPTSSAIIGRLRAALKPGGYLVLGSSENLLGRDQGFAADPEGGFSIYRANGAAP